MPPSIDVLTSSSAAAWPTALMALKSPLPSPNVMVPKQSLETKRPVLPSVAYSTAFSFLASPKLPYEGIGGWHGRLPSVHPFLRCRMSEHSLIHKQKIIQRPPSKTHQTLPLCSALPVQAHGR